MAAALLHHLPSLPSNVHPEDNMRCFTSLGRPRIPWCASHITRNSTPTLTHSLFSLSLLLLLLTALDHTLGRYHSRSPSRVLQRLSTKLLRVPSLSLSLSHRAKGKAPNKPKMTDKSAYGGLFQDPPYLSSDPDPAKSDPYDTQDCIPSRYLGKNMMTGGAACPGQHPDAYFDKKYMTLASADQNAEVYAAHEKSERRRAAAEAKHPMKPVSDSEFRYTSFPSKSTGPGSYYGCFQGRPYAHDVDPTANATKQEKKLMKKRAEAAAAAAEEEKRIRALPNIKTAPPKKGTYGCPGVLLSKEVYDESWRADMDGDGKKARKAAGNEASPQPMGPPFRVPGVNKSYLDELPATGVSGVYSAYTPPEEKTGRKGKKKDGQQQNAEPASIHEKPFYGGNPKGGKDSCINPFPNTWYDPREDEAAAAKKSRSGKKEKAAVEPTRPKGADEWKPNSFGHTSVISSCLRRFY